MRYLYLYPRHSVKMMLIAIENGCTPSCAYASGVSGLFYWSCGEKMQRIMEENDVDLGAWVIIGCLLKLVAGFEINVLTRQESPRCLILGYLPCSE
jgi:hypothetical protein